MLPPLYPNAGLERIYRRHMTRVLEAMHKEVIAEIQNSYPKSRLAQDESPLAKLLRMMRGLGRKWTRRFEALSKKLAKYFATDASKRVDGALKAMLKDAGMSVEWRPTPAMQDIMQATVNANVQLIKSIPTQYLGQVEVLVMQSVQAGRKLNVLTRELQRQFGVTKKRAALIARDQNNKATAAMTRARQLEAGVTKAVWMHSRAGKEPRPTHVANDGKLYNIETGWYDPAERRYIIPGELINCRCTSRAVVTGVKNANRR